MKANIFIASALLIASLLIVLENAANAVPESVTVNVEVTEKGFEPDQIKVKSGDSVVLKITRKTDRTCATAVQIPSLKIKKALPLNKEVVLKLGNLSKGEIKFGCTMDMMEGGVIHAD